LGGHVASAETWAKFAADWEELLKPCGILGSNGNYRFKMSEIPITPDGMWRVQCFFKAIERHEIISISSLLKKSDLKAAAKQKLFVTTGYRGYQPLEVGWGPWDNVFILLWRTIMDMFLDQRGHFSCVIPVDAPVSFIFDEQTEKRTILDGWDDYIHSKPPQMTHRFGKTPRFESDDDFLPLQAADFWAWWTRERFYPSKNRSPEARRLINEFIEELKNSKRPRLNAHLECENLRATFLTVAMDEFFKQQKYM
jgi:hypothetical protein